MKLYFGGVRGRSEDPQHAISMRFLYATLVREGISFYEGTLWGDALVSRARSKAATQFLRTDADVLVSIDSDIEFDPKDVLSIATKAMDLGIVGGLYMKRNPDEGGVAQRLHKNDIYFTPDAEPVEVDYISGGFVAVHRRVFERIVEECKEPHDYDGVADIWPPYCHESAGEDAFWPFYMPFCHRLNPDGDTLYLSEDWAFEQRAHFLGFKSYLDPTVRLLHWGAAPYRMPDGPQALVIDEDGKRKFRRLEAVE